MFKNLPSNVQNKQTCRCSRFCQTVSGTARRLVRKSKLSGTRDPAIVQAFLSNVSNKKSNSIECRRFFARSANTLSYQGKNAGSICHSGEGIVWQRAGAESICDR